MLTSESERSVRLAAIEAGATEFLSKPFDALELKARIVNLLKLRRFQLDLAGQADMLQRLVDNATAKLAAREEEIIWRLARAIEYPPMRLRGLLAVTQRVLNIDGYAVLSRDESSDTVELDRELLCRQFDLV